MTVKEQLHNVLGRLAIIQKTKETEVMVVRLTDAMIQLCHILLEIQEKHDGNST